MTNAHPEYAQPTAPTATDAPGGDMLVPACRWAVFLAGVALLIAAALVPPAEDLEHIRETREHTLAIERHDLRRLANYQAMADALDAGDPETIRLVLASELQLVPEGSTALVNPGRPDDPRLFELLEPGGSPPKDTTATQTPSALTRLTTDPIGRFMLLLVAAVAVLWGCIPPGSKRR